MNGEETGRVNSSSPSSLAVFSWCLALLSFSNRFGCKVGFRFHPNDEQIIDQFLKKKIQGDSEADESIAEVDVLKFEPWDLPAFSKEKSKDPFWYFFYQLDYKSKGVNRKTVAGYWKATGKDRKVRSRDTQKIIGIKKTLVFYEGRVSKKVKSVRTKWVIHEYHVTADFPNPKAYVICRLKKKADGKASTLTHDEVESSCQKPSDFGNHVALTHDEIESCCQSPSYFGNHGAENTVLEVNPPSQADPGSIISCDELDHDIFSELLDEHDQDLPSDCNRFQIQFDITEPPLLSNSLSGDSNGVQTQSGTTEPPLSNSFSGDSNGVQTQSGTTEPPSSNSFSGNCKGAQTQFDITEPPSSNGFSGDCNGVQTQSGTNEPPSSNSFSGDCKGIQTQFGSTEEDLAYMNFNWDVDDMSLDTCWSYSEEHHIMGE